MGGRVGKGAKDIQSFCPPPPPQQLVFPMFNMGLPPLNLGTRRLSPLEQNPLKKTHNVMYPLKNEDT